MPIHATSFELQMYLTDGTKAQISIITNEMYRVKQGVIEIF